MDVLADLHFAAGIELTLAEVEALARTSPRRLALNRRPRLYDTIHDAQVTSCAAQNG